MKYTLAISGRGATVSFGSLSDEIYKYVKTFESPKAYLEACEEGKVPAEFRISSENFLDNDGDIFHALVAFPGDSVITVTDSNGKTVFEHEVVTFGNMYGPGLEIRPRPTSKFPDAVRIWGYWLHEKGDFWRVEFEAGSFDPAKLRVRVLSPMIDFDDQRASILCLWVDRVEYDGTELDRGDVDTTEEGCGFKLFKIRPLSKLVGAEWASLLDCHPEYAERCDWSKLSDEDWEYLLSGQPQFADKRTGNKSADLPKDSDEEGDEDGDGDEEEDGDDEDDDGFEDDEDDWDDDEEE